MAEEAQTELMIEGTTPKKVAFMSKPYSQEERIKKDEEELEQLLKEQKNGVESSKEKTDRKNKSSKNN